MAKRDFRPRWWLNDGRIRLGAIVFLSALGLALFAIVMRPALMAAPVDVAPTWGKVLIVGGYDVCCAQSSTDLYDPATNGFAAAADTAAMNTGRDEATATLLASGKVLIAGGFNGNYKGPPLLSSTELYDPATNSFAAARNTATMNTAREGATATLLASGKVLIAGGLGSGVGTSGFLSSTELYDPATNSFAAAADTAVMNTARAYATATLLASGKVLIAGGANGPLEETSSTELYDPATNSFAAASDTAAMNTARLDATATPLPSGEVLIAGGEDSSGALSSTELYDPATNSFAAAADTAAMNTARVLATATLLASGEVLIAGGAGPSGAVLSSTELYDPATNSFAAAGDTAAMNTARLDATATLLPSGQVLIAGGNGDDTSGPLSSTELYDPASNSFAAASDTATMNTARTSAVAILLPTPNGRLTLLPSTLDFGTVKVGQSSAAQTVTLSNGTGKNLIISGWSIGRDFKIVSTTCSLPPPSPTVLPAGESCSYMLSFDPQSAGTKNELFQVVDSAPKSPLKAKLQGVGKRR